MPNTTKKPTKRKISVTCARSHAVLFAKSLYFCKVSTSCGWNMPLVSSPLSSKTARRPFSPMVWKPAFVPCSSNATRHGVFAFPSLSFLTQVGQRGSRGMRGNTGIRRPPISFVRASFGIMVWRMCFAVAPPGFTSIFSASQPSGDMAA